MRVKDITGRNHNIKPENVQLHYEKARGLTYWYNNFKIRLVLTDDQKNIIKQVVAGSAKKENIKIRLEVLINDFDRNITTTEKYEETKNRKVA